MKLCGTGIVFSGGRGLPALKAALTTDFSAQFSFKIPPDALKDRAVLGDMRRADRFSKMATLAAYDAVAQNGTPLENPERTGVVFATAFGPHNTTFGFLDEILTYGDAAVSPTVFSNSVHNAAVSYISNTLKIKGPTWTITCFKNPFEQALQLAQLWLEEGRCDQVLVGAGDECGAVLEYIVSQKMEMAGTAGQMRPFFDPAGPAVIPGELAVFFLLSRDTTGGVQIEMRSNNLPPDLLMIDFESRNPDFRAGQVRAGCWSHRAGTTPLSAAFHCAVASLMLKEKTIYWTADLLDGLHGAGEEDTARFPSRVECGEKISVSITKEGF